MKYLWLLTSVDVLGQIRQDPGKGLDRSRGSPSSKNQRLEGYSDKPNAWQYLEACGEKVFLLLDPF